MFGIGASELIVILVIVLLIYGGKRLPELGSSFGKAIRNFRGATSESDEIVIASPDRKTAPSEAKKDDATPDQGERSGPKSS